MAKVSNNIFEVYLTRTITVGTILSATLILIGILLLFITNTTGYSNNYNPINIIEIINGMLKFKPYAFINSGIVLLIATPFFRVFISIFLFLITKNYIFAIISLLVLFILIISLVIGNLI